MNVEVISPVGAVKPTMSEMVAAVKAHAMKNYSKGWDFVIETMSVVEIEQIIGGAKTIKGAIWKMSRELGPAISHRLEIEATAF